MFKLQNGKTIDIDIIMLGLQDSDLANSYFLDTQTGEVEFLSDHTDDKKENQLEEIKNQDNRFIRIPQITSYDQYQWMKEFVDEFVSHEEEKNEHLSEKLSIALNGKGAFRRFKDVLANAGKGWMDSWHQWQNDHLYEELREWLISLPIGVSEAWEPFDDCAICQVMTKGDTSTQELLKAFQKQNIKNKEQHKTKKHITN